jgi:hypothetical protein
MNECEGAHNPAPRPTACDRIGRLPHAAVIAFVLLIAAMARSAESSITVAWDPATDQQVVGYKVCVGTTPGIYSESYGVDGSQTSFVYNQTAAGVRYYFVVASVGTGGVVGPRSPEVSDIAYSGDFAPTLVSVDACPAPAQSVEEQPAPVFTAPIPSPVPTTPPLIPFYPAPGSPPQAQPEPPQRQPQPEPPQRQPQPEAPQRQPQPGSLTPLPESPVPSPISVSPIPAPGEPTIEPAPVTSMPSPDDPAAAPSPDRYAVPRGSLVRGQEPAPSASVGTQFSVGQRVRLASAGAATYVATLLADGLGSISDLTPTPDGRLLFIEDRQRVRLLTGAGVAPGAALESGRTLTGLALDPAFAETGLLFVGESEPRRDGIDALSIVRYRERRGWLGEGAAVVTGLPLPRAGVAPFTVDAARHIHVAVPTTGQRRADPYEGHLLRFNADGTVPADNRGASPIVAVGFTRPTAVVWGTGGQLWLAGFHERSPVTLARLDSPAQRSDQWPRVPAGVAVDPPASAEPAISIASMALADPLAARQDVFVITQSGSLVRGVLDTSGLARLEAISLDAFGTPVAIAGGHHGIYVAVRTAAGDGSTSFAILRVTW